MNSVWSEYKNQNNFKTLDGDLKTDVLIIGGGMAGILCAFRLQQCRVDYALIEGGRIGCGITKNTTAKITAQHSLIYASIIKMYGLEKAKQYLQSNLSAIERYRKLCDGVDCDFEEKPSFVYTLNNKRKIENELNALNRLGYGAEYEESLPLPIDIKGAVKFTSQAQFNPLKFINHISRGLNIYENTFAEKIRNHTVKTRNGTITARKIIVATHFPMINIAGLYSLKLYQHRSYVLALENAPNVDGMYVDEADKGLSFRNYKDLLLIGGGDHRTGKEGGNWQELRSFKKANYPNSIEKYFWATQDCMSLDRIPYIGNISSLYPDIYVATGFNKWGMTSSMVSSEVLCDMVVGKKNDFAAVFNPHRSIFHKQLGINILEALSNLLSFKKRRCSHLGCALKWNKVEKTWDCPCHGSRYDRNGNIIDNPAKKSIVTNEKGA